MNIALDIDGILANADIAFRLMMRSLFKRPFPKKKVKSFHYEESFDLTNEEIKLLYKMFHKEELWLNMKPVKGAVSSAQKLAKEHRIIIVTARPREVRKVTLKWLKKYKIPYEKIYFTLADKHLLFDNYNEKVDVFLEDHPIYIKRLAETQTNVIMFDYPWNRNVKGRPNIYHVNKWPEAMKVISKLKKNL
jgi:uncharacterized HAD superfamily protein